MHRLKSSRSRTAKKKLRKAQQVPKCRRFIDPFPLSSDDGYAASCAQESPLQLLSDCWNAAPCLDRSKTNLLFGNFHASRSWEWRCRRFIELTERRRNRRRPSRPKKKTRPPDVALFSTFSSRLGLSWIYPAGGTVVLFLSRLFFDGFHRTRKPFKSISGVFRDPKRTE